MTDSSANPCHPDIRAVFDSAAGSDAMAGRKYDINRHESEGERFEERD